jgi:hypothetical protein
MSSWLDAIEARVKAATPGPWRQVEEEEDEPALNGERGIVSLAPGVPLGGLIIGTLYTDDGLLLAMTDSNADFIARAREDVPALLACVRALGEALETIAIREHPDHFGSRRVAKTALTLYRTGPTPPAEETTR